MITNCCIREIKIIKNPNRLIYSRDKSYNVIKIYIINKNIMALNNQQKLEKVINALEKINPETKAIILNMAKNMTDLATIQSFNQASLDLFTEVLKITTRIGKESEYKIGGYKTLFDNAIKINAKLPIDKFTLIILEFAPLIYDQSEDIILSMPIPDAKVTVANEFGMIRSEKFKNLWKTLDDKQKDILKDKIILLTTYAHVYFYQTVLKSSNK